MPTAGEMRALGEEIVASQRARTAAVIGFKADTGAFMDELAAGTTARKSETAATLGEYDAAHQAMARETRERLAQDRAAMKTDTAAFVDELAAGTAARKADVTSQLAEYATEMTEARAAWREHLGAPPPPPVVEVAPPPPPPPVVEVAPPPPPVEQVIPDDLTAIRGIGASMQARLTELGITTFAQLAEASPDEVRERLGDFGRLARVEQWIAQARELV